MDKLAEQITELKVKIELLYELMERLTNQVNQVILQRETSSVLSESNLNPLLVSSFSLINHQDVLIDDRGGNINSINQDPIEPEIQIKRLTAQLTAAYNRIAALEEQLMRTSKR